MRALLLLIILSIPLLFSACTSGKKAFERGSYYEACVKAINRLRQKPNHKKSKEILRKSYPLAIQTLEDNAQQAMISNDQYKYKKKLQAYEAINNLHQNIKASPAARKVISNPKNYFAEVADLKEKAAEESYAIGMNYLSNNTREDAKQAYYHFRDVDSFVPGFKDVRSKMDEAKFTATLKVIVEQIPVPSIYSLSADFFQDKVEEYLHSQYRSNEFVRFYTQAEADAEDLPYVDQYLRLQFDDFVVGETHIERITETFTRDSVVVGKTKVRDGKEVNVYGTVKAKLTVNRKEVKSRGLFSMRAVDAHSKAVLTHRKFTGEFIWFTQWGNFNGDERALTDEQLAICAAYDVPPPAPQVLFIEFTKPIYDQLVPALNQFYQQY
ncbi:hypothetical protein [Fulvivirga lutea]|uniref:Lipoprotein n=1 Tax=Fulvivirga lutea TaxID=2810512 RepID=A0A974WJP7_9BACT|nr:hypothetical protein [Fulvivirga lutea]QSE96603.1 hypothetical protein JR347_13490 [Fulvivirga lutea]